MEVYTLPELTVSDYVAINIGLRAPEFVSLMKHEVERLRALGETAATHAVILQYELCEGALKEAHQMRSQRLITRDEYRRIVTKQPHLKAEELHRMRSLALKYQPVPTGRSKYGVPIYYVLDQQGNTVWLTTPDHGVTYHKHETYPIEFRGYQYEHHR